MKDKHIYTICAAVYIAPHAGPVVGIGIAVWLAVCALYSMWREEK